MEARKLYWRIDVNDKFFSIKEQLLLMFATFILASGVVYAMYIVACMIFYPELLK